MTLSTVAQSQTLRVESGDDEEAAVGADLYTSQQAALFGEAVASELETRTVEPFVASSFNITVICGIWLSQRSLLSMPFYSVVFFGCPSFHLCLLRASLFLQSLRSWWHVWKRVSNRLALLDDGHGS